MEQIPYEEITFHPHSYGDPDGRLFLWNRNLYRAISHKKTPFFRQLFKDGTLQRLIDRGTLIDSEPVEWSVDGYGMVLRHRHVPFVSYPHEWCPEMFRDAALAYVDLVSELVPLGLMLKDTHPWNLLFDGSRPIYVDLTSIKPLTGHSDYVVYDKFCRYYLYPLMLMAGGHERIARHLLPDYEGILQSDFSQLMGRPLLPTSSASKKYRFARSLQERVPKAYRERLKNGLSLVRSLMESPSRRRNCRLTDLKRVKEEIESVTLPAFRPLHLDCDTKSALSSQNICAASQTCLGEIITEVSPSSILAIGAKWRECSLSLAHAGQQVVTFDKDSAGVTELYRDTRDKKLSILPLVMDFSDPTPSRGLASHLSIAAAERLRCDMVVALGLVRQIVSERHLRFDQVVDGLAQFSKRWLVIDFEPFDHCNRSSDVNSWYTLENFIAAAGKKFMKVRLLPRPPESGELLLCEK
jgi:hypothetical protein